MTKPVITAGVHVCMLTLENNTRRAKLNQLSALLIVVIQESRDEL